EREAQALALREGLDQTHEALEVADEIVPLDAKAEARLLQLAEIEQIPDQARQFDAAALHRHQRRALRVRDGPELAVDHEAKRREDQRERRLEFVGDVGEELRLEAALALELL